MKSNYSEKIKINSLIRILVFIAGTFILSWSFDWLQVKVGGFEALKSTGSISPVMLAPAFVALVLQIFFFRDSKIYYKTYRETPRWIFYSFFILFFSL